MKKGWGWFILALCLCWHAVSFAGETEAQWIAPQWERIQDTFTYEDCTVKVDALVEHPAKEWVQSWQAKGSLWGEDEANHLQRTMFHAEGHERHTGWTSDEYSYQDEEGGYLNLSPGCLTYRHPQEDAYVFSANPSYNAGQWFAQAPVPEEVPPLEGVPFAQVVLQAGAALEPLGLTLGMPEDVQFWDREAQQRMLEAVSVEFKPDLEGAEAEEPCYRFSLPVYFDGWRLGPGIVQSVYGDIYSMESGIVEALVSTEGIRSLSFAHVFFSDATSIGEPEQAMTAEQALACYRNISQSTAFDSGGHCVERVLPQYILSWQEAAGKAHYTYTLTPAWCFYITWEDEEIDSAIALPLLPSYGEVILHAVTGELLYPRY